MSSSKMAMSRVLRCLLLSAAAALLTCRIALAQTPVIDYVVIQPIDVCLSTGWTSTLLMSCAPYNTLDNNPNPTKFTNTTPIGFIDTATNVNDTRRIWLQSGVDITFLPMAFYFNASATTSNYLAITDLTCTSTSCSSKTFSSLSSGKIRPAPPVSTNSTTINMFFVNKLAGDSTVASPVYGFAWIGANGVAVSSNTFFPGTGQLVHYDTLGHEIGHNLGLDHATFGAGPSSSCPGQPFPGGCNVMDAGNYRNVPLGTGCSTQSSTSTSGGALYLLDDVTCTTKPALGVLADQLILGSGSNTQQSAVLSSVFLNPIPNVNATAGGGDVSFTVTYPKFNKSGGRNGEYIAAVVLALPAGFQFGTNKFTQTGGTAVVVSVEQLNGNNGQGNSNCVKPIAGGPSIQCLEIDFKPGTFTNNTSVSFTSDIIDKASGQPVTAANLGSLGCTTTASQQCLDLTYVFSDLLATTSAFQFRDNTGNLNANSQLPDETVAATIVDPTNFPTLNPNQVFVGFNQTGCNPTSTSPSCPSAAHGGVPTQSTPDGSD